MIVTVQFDSTSTEDAEALTRLFGSANPAEWPPRDFPTASERHEAAAKAEAKKAAEKAPEPVETAPEPEPEPEPTPEPEPVEEAAPEPEPGETPTKLTTADAQKRAVEVLATNGGRDRVKAALAAAGAERISKLKASQLETFVKELG